MMVIDEHRHIGYCLSKGTRTVRDILAEMDRMGVDRAVIVASGVTDEGPTTQREQEFWERGLADMVRECIEKGQVTPEVESVRRRRVDHGEVLDAVRTHSERLMGCWWVNPWRADEDLEEACAAVSDDGFRYLKLHPMIHAFAADDEVVFPVVERAAELTVPVWFHCSYGPGSEIQRVARTARRFPRTEVILGHAGVGDPEGTTHSADAAAAAMALENVWIDLSNCGEKAMRRMIENGPADRLLLASDDPFGSLEQQMDHIRGIAGTDESLIRKIMGENAARLLGLS